MVRRTAYGLSRTWTSGGMSRSPRPRRSAPRKARPSRRPSTWSRRPSRFSSSPAARGDGRLIPSDLDRRRVLIALRRLGFTEMREGRRHTVLEDPLRGRNVAIPRHSRVMRGTLVVALRRAGVSPEEFMDVY
ncbi:MAG: type II toxin-antitoxin system HicA family toxin [Armatimonadetes bacterium]|nr:type II toxin-antitoxin system HicA family toxin [Armatimonadota bacterium]